MPVTPTLREQLGRHGNELDVDDPLTGGTH
jgi:hypothetical protein